MKSTESNPPQATPKEVAEAVIFLQESAFADILAEFAAGMLSEEEEAEVHELIKTNPIAATLWAEISALPTELEPFQENAEFNDMAKAILDSLPGFRELQGAQRNVAVTPPGLSLTAVPPISPSTFSGPSAPTAESPKQRQNSLLSSWSSGFTEGFRTQERKAAAATGKVGVGILWQTSDEDGQRRIVKHPNGRIFLEIFTRDPEIAAAGVTIRLVEPAPVIRFEGCGRGIFSGQALIPSDFADKVISGEKAIELDFAPPFETQGSDE